MSSRYGMAVLLFVAMLGVGCKADVPQTRTRKVTGRVEKANDSVLLLRVGAEQWELKVTPDTQIPSDLKDGAPVSVEYALVAKVVTARAEPPRSTKPTRPRAD
jgi:hypothetical protein